MAALPPPPPPSNFQFKSKNLFLTFPQCDFPLSDFCEKVKVFFAPLTIKKGVASQELHEDGNKHLHLFVELDKACQTRSVKFFDNLVSPPKHPNIVSRLKSKLKTVKYIIKDGNYQVLPDEDSFDLQLFLAQAQNKKSTAISEKIVKMIKKGKTLDEVDEKHPSYMMQHLQSIQRYSDFLGLKERRQSRALALQTPFLVCPAAGHNNSLNKDLALWLNQNIRTLIPRAHKTPQLWLRSSPNMGKTTLIKSLQDAFDLSIYYLPLNEKWYDGYADGCYDLIVLDEYKAHKKITDLNPILSGDPVPLSRRSSPPILKRENLPVIILSNYLPHECYHKASPMAIAPLMCRLKVIDFQDTPIRIIKEESIPETPPPTPPSDYSDPELEQILLELPVPQFDDPEPLPAVFNHHPDPAPQIYQEIPELDPNSDFFFSDAYLSEVRERMKRPRSSLFSPAPPTISLRDKRNKKAARNNALINRFFDSEAQDESESGASESDDDSIHSSDEDFLDDSDPSDEEPESLPIIAPPVRRIRFLLED